MDKIHLNFDIEPRAKQSARFRAHQRTAVENGKLITRPAIASFKEKSVKSYEQAIALMAKAQMKNTPLMSGAIHATVLYYFRHPKKIPRSMHQKMFAGERVYKITKPDLTDNLQKGLFDSLEGIAFTNDSQVAKMTVEKLYSHTPRIEVTLRRLDGYFKAR